MRDAWEFDVPSKRNDICYTSESIRHPAKMELNMCRKIIKLYSKPGDLICDPMAGVGTTMVEAMILGRNAVGIEYEEKFADMAKDNIRKTGRSMKFLNKLGKAVVFRGDSRRLGKILSVKADRIIFSPPFANDNTGRGLQKRRLKGELTKKDIRMGNCVKKLSEDPGNIDNVKGYGKVDSIITSPPYVDNIADFSKFTPPHDSRRNLDKKDHKYSDDSKNIGNMKGKDYLSEMLLIYKECHAVLKIGGFMVLVLKNFVRAGKQVRLDNDTIKLCEAAGFKFIKRHYRLIKNPSFWITNAIQKWEKKNQGEHPYPLHEDVLVFKKEVVS